MYLDTFYRIHLEWIEQAGLSERAKVIELDVFSASLWPATVVTMFFGDRDAAKLERKLRRLSPGTRMFLTLHQ